ncbi:hypothetical protein [Rhodovibrio salinarum]|uniref:Uncharacterized protein n=1 Tax=Rhodovibrio salinarum TaxID=1087 RepID=A0A934QH31_9PROT|nr:hypothetical protein [Rhodovibrio salinarum]MBK1696390.1 hypothetical protein [Rhodovibrio salinarum]
MIDATQNRDFPVATALSVGLSVDGRTVFAVAETRAHGRRAVLLAESTLQKLLDHAGNALRAVKTPDAARADSDDLLALDRIGEAAGGNDRFAHYADWEDAPTVLVNEVTVVPQDGHLLLAFAGTRQTFGRGVVRDGEPAFKLLLDREAAYRVLGMMGERARSAGLIQQTAAAWLFEMAPAAPTWVH